MQHQNRPPSGGRLPAAYFAIMTTSRPPADILTQTRTTAVAATMQQIRAIIGAALEPTPQQLEQVAACLRQLAALGGLFPDAHFPGPDEGVAETLYLLSEDDDLNNALYLYRPAPGMSTPPHDHSTWAVIAGIEGEEPNTVWQSGTAPESGLQISRRFSVGPGQSACFTHDQIHSIAIAGERAIKHLHLYGHSLLDLPRRRDFNAADGSSWLQTEKPLVLPPQSLTAASHA